MNVILHRRAEIGFRSLEEDDRARISAALERLKHMSPGELPRVPELKHIATEHGDKLFAYNAGNAMRLVLSVGSEGITIEDIAPKERLESVA